MLRSALYTDSITSAAARFYNLQKSERGGDLLNQLAPVGMVVRDLLAAIGLPENAIVMVMGVRDAYELGVMGSGVDHPMPCALCGSEATGIVEFGTGPRAACEACIADLHEQWVYLTFPVEVPF